MRYHYSTDYYRQQRRKVSDLASQRCKEQTAGLRGNPPMHVYLAIAAREQDAFFGLGDAQAEGRGEQYFGKSDLMKHVTSKVVLKVVDE